MPAALLADMPANEEDWCAMAQGEHPASELIVCEVEDRIVGFACYGSARPPSFGYSGELYATYFLPSAIGKGYGAATMRTAMTALARLGHADMVLWVMEQNVRGQRFYQRAGGVVLPDSRRSLSIHEATIWEIAYGFRPLPASPATR